MRWSAVWTTSLLAGFAGGLCGGFYMAAKLTTPALVAEVTKRVLNDLPLPAGNLAEPKTRLTEKGFYIVPEGWDRKH